MAQLPERSLDDRLDDLKYEAMLGPDVELWRAVETLNGVVYNQYRNMQENDNETVYFCFSKNTASSIAYMTVTYPTWQEAAKDYLAWASFGVKNNGNADGKT